MARPLRRARQELHKAEERLARQQGLVGCDPATREARAHVEASHAEVRRLEAVPSVYRPHLAALSLTPHPFGSSDTAMDALAAFAGCHQRPSLDDALKRLRKEAPALVALVDFWWGQGNFKDRIGELNPLHQDKLLACLEGQGESCEGATGEFSLWSRNKKRKNSIFSNDLSYLPLLLGFTVIRTSPQKCSVSSSIS